jgi:hypothetical protein
MSFEVIRLPDTALALEGGDLAEFFDTLDGLVVVPVDDLDELPAALDRLGIEPKFASFITGRTPRALRTSNLFRYGDTVVRRVRRACDAPVENVA